jgi:uncharacterized protein YbaP (TraB family)
MRRIALVFALLAPVACGGTQPTCQLVPRPAAMASPFLWKVQRAGGPVVWLYGTIHNAGATDVPAAAWAALESSPRFVSELGDREPDPDQAGELARLPSGKGLDAQLPADDWYDLRDALRGTVKEDDLKRARPWFAMTRLSARLAPSPSPTMDDALAARAREHELPVDNLESWDVQLAALADAVTIKDLQQAIHARRTMRCELDQMRAFYATGDLAIMERILVEGQSATLLEQRTQVWLGKLEPYLATGGAFVAVGLGHLAGPHGLPAMLVRAGYTVERAR